MSVVVHKLSSYLPPIIEIHRGSTELDDVLLANLHSWIRAFYSATSTGAREILEQRWHPLHYDGTRRLRDFILSYEPTSMGVCLPAQNAQLFEMRCDKDASRSADLLSTLGCEEEPTQFVLMERSGRRAVNGKTERDLFLIPPPPETDEIRWALRRTGLEGVPGICEFLTAFGGMAEHLSLLQGRFLSGKELYNQRDTTDQILIRSGWNASVILYTSVSGDTLCLHENGSVAWELHDVHEIRDVQMTLDEFVGEFARYREKWSILDACDFLEFLERGK